MKFFLNLSFLLFPFFVSAQQLDSINNNGVKVFYEVSGQGEPIYVLSGGPGITPAYMNPIIAELSKKYQCVLIHQRGTGKTIVPITKETIQIEKYDQDIDFIKNKLGHKKIILLGHSWGGMLAMDYAAHHPNDVSKLVLIGSGGYNLDFLSYFSDNIFSKLSQEDQRMIRVYDSFNGMMGKNKANSQVHTEMQYLGTEFMNTFTHGYVYDKASAEKVTLKPEEINMDILEVIFGTLAEKGWDLKKQLETLNISTLIIQGRQDPIDYQTAEDIHAALKGSKLHFINQSGHFPWIEQREEFFKTIWEFL